MNTTRKLLIPLALGLVALAGAATANADWPATRTTVNARGAVQTDRTKYEVTAVVFAHGSNVQRVQFGSPGRWGVDGRFVRQRANGGLVYKATIFGHPGGSWQARSFVNGKPDDYSSIATLP